MSILTLPRRSTLTLALTFVVSMAINLPLSAAAQTPQRGGTLVVAFSQAPRHLNGAVQSGVASAGSFDSMTGVWTLPSLDAGASQTLTLTLSAPAVSGQLTLTTTANAANASSATQSTVVQVSAPAGPGGPVDPSDPTEPTEPTEPVKAAVPVPTGSTLMLMLLTLAFAGMGAAQQRARSKR